MHQKLLKMARKKLSTMLPPYSPNSRWPASFLVVVSAK
jgi:hypothetical protein